MKIELRKWTLEDKEELIRVSNSINRSYLSNRLPNPYTEINASNWLGMVFENEGKEGLFRAIVVEDIIVGNISVSKKSDVYHLDCEIGYTLVEDYSGKGIMSEAVKLMCELAFEQLDVLRISASVYEPNKASSRILEKNGFLLEGMLKNAVSKDGNIYDLKSYGKTKE